MYKGTLIDSLLGVVEGAEKTSQDASLPTTQRKDESNQDVVGEGENQSPNSSRNRLV